MWGWNLHGFKPPRLALAGSTQYLWYVWVIWTHKSHGIQAEHTSHEDIKWAWPINIPWSAGQSITWVILRQHILVSIYSPYSFREIYAGLTLLLGCRLCSIWVQEIERMNWMWFIWHNYIYLSIYPHGYRDICVQNENWLATNVNIGILFGVQILLFHSMTDVSHCGWRQRCIVCPAWRLSSLYLSNTWNGYLCH